MKTISNVTMNIILNSIDSFCMTEAGSGTEVMIQGTTQGEQINIIIPTLDFLEFFGKQEREHAKKEYIKYIKSL
tara:strand:+ start:97 stop:318 length:222 start_codon:yes stop_codon:yes gene_type:complete